ncbi:histidine acid phosphatase, eukaryotic [Tanacetum coccineum]
MVKEPNEMIEDENVFMNCEENIKSKEFVANDSNEVIDNEIDKEVLNEASKACDERKGFESKKSSDVDNDYNYFVGCVVVTSYVRVEQSLLGSKQYEFGGVGEPVPSDISKQGMGGIEPILNDAFVGIADKLTDHWLKISTFMETQVGNLSIRLWLGSYGYQICLTTFLLEQVLEYSKGIRRPIRYEVRKCIQENEFVSEKVPDQCNLIYLNLVARHGTCTPTKKRIQDLHAFWQMKNDVNCVVVESVQGVSQLNHLDSSQSMMEEEGTEAYTELVPELVHTEVGIELA